MGIPLRTLIIEDSEDDALLIVRLLQKSGYDPKYKRVETAEAMHEALERQTWGIIISDYKMPHFNGLEALKLYKEKGLDIPFIIVSGTIGEEIAATAMVSGAHDYVMKNNLPRLVPAIQRELREAESRRERKLAKQELLLTDMRQEALLKLYQMADTPLDTITGFVVEECLKMTGSEIAFIGYINEDETIMHTHLWSKKAMRQCSVDRKPVKFPIEQAGLWGEAIRQKKPIIANNYADPNPYKKGCPEGHIPLIRFMSVPLVDRNRVVLVAGVGNKKEPYTGSDITHTSLFLEGMWDYIQRRKAEDRVRTSEEKYRSIFENAVEGIFQTAPEGRFITVNPAMAHMHGFASPEEMVTGISNIGTQLYVNREDRERYRAILEEKGEVNNFEAQVYRKDGNTIWSSTNARAIRDAAGNVSCFEGTAEDITSRKLAEEELKQATEKLRKSLVGTIRAMSLTVETRDPYTAGHQRRVSNLARTIAQEMGLSNDIVDTIRMAGIIHDIGKISVPAEILSKPTKLTDIEFSLIQVHSQTGYDILKDVGLPYPIAEIILQHHERLDGSGYPQGLKNGQILLESQIISVADVVEAIASHRPYRPGFGIDVALEEIETNKGILYDAEVVEACLKLFREKNFIFE